MRKQSELNEGENNVHSAQVKLLCCLEGNSNTSYIRKRRDLKPTTAAPIPEIQSLFPTNKQKRENKDLRQNQIQLTKRKSMKCFLIIFCCMHRSVPCPVVIKEAFSGSRWRQVQRPTARHYAEGEREGGVRLNWRFLLASSSLRLVNPVEGREIVRVRGGGSHQQNKVNESTKQS